MIDGLHGNGERCPACAMRREANPWASNVPCNRCSNTGWLQKPTAQIIAESAEWARINYWPAKEKAWAEQNRRAGV